MCGIFGVINIFSEDAPSLDKLEASVKLLHHRGPDASGTFSSRGIGFAHARLSLVDPEPRSNQPFWDVSGRYCLVYNGEIYNFKDLRTELEQQGVGFHTSSDTEVLLNGLIHFGTDILPRLEGMFAFSFYDKQTGSVVLARDRFGMKPLYLYQDENKFLFSSEVKAFKPWINFEINPFSLSSYLLGFGGPTKGASFYNGVLSLTPGSYVNLERGKQPVHHTFFSMPDFFDPEEAERLNGFSPAKMVDHVEELMYRSVENHMFADSPVGAYCSGGVDSSLLMAMAAKTHNNLAIFHANVLGPWSEFSAAKALSKHLKLDLNVVDVKEADFISQMPDVINQYEYPHTYHPNCAPFIMVSRLARDTGIKGLLSGEGSDELFLGYPWLGRESFVNSYYQMGAKLRGLVHRIPELGRILWPEQSNNHNVVRDFLNQREIADDRLDARQKLAELNGSIINKDYLTSIDYLNYHLRTLLHRNDTQGMEASIESRFPFLDHNLVRTAVNMPRRFKLRFSPKTFEKAHPFIRDKWVIRKVADRWVPRELSQRVKMGFWTTSAERMVVPAEYFKDSFIQNQFGLTASQIKSTLDEADQDLKLRLLHLDIWARICLMDEPLDSVRVDLEKTISIRPG